MVLQVSDGPFIHSGVFFFFFPSQVLPSPVVKANGVLVGVTGNFTMRYIASVMFALSSR